MSGPGSRSVGKVHQVSWCGMASTSTPGRAASRRTAASSRTTSSRMRGMASSLRKRCTARGACWTEAREGDSLPGDPAKGCAMPLSRILSLAIVALVTPGLDAQTKRPRLTEEKPAGVREKLSLGTLFVPDGVLASGKVPLFLHFHGPGWIAEVAAARMGDMAVVHAQLGSGSSVYGK